MSRLDSWRCNGGRWHVSTCWVFKKKENRSKRANLMLKALFIFLSTEPYYSSLFHLGERAKLTTSSVPRDWIQMDEVLRRFSVHNKIQATVLKQQRVWSGFHRLAMAVPRTASSNFPILLQPDVYRAVWIIYSHCRPDWDDHHLTM